MVNNIHYIERKSSISNMATRNNPLSAEPPRIGETLAALRQQRGLSLDELSRTAGVSKSMLSQIERAQANPTVAVVWRLANALGVGMADLLEGIPTAAPAVIEKVAVHATPGLRTPDGLGALRILGPLDLAGRFEWYALDLQPGGMLDSQAHEGGTFEHLTVVEGALEVRSGAEALRLDCGETARYQADRPHALVNVGTVPVKAWLVVVHQ